MQKKTDSPDPHLFPPQEPPSAPVSTSASEFIGCAISTMMIVTGVVIVALAALAPFWLVYLVAGRIYGLFS